MDVGAVEAKTDATSVGDTTEDGGRLVVTLIVAVGLCIGLPIWWKTTEVHRAPLPTMNLDASANLLPAHSAVVLNVVLLTEASNGISKGDAAVLLRTLEKLQPTLSGYSKTGSSSGEAVTGSKISHADQQDGQSATARLTCISPTSCVDYGDATMGHQERVCHLRWDIPSPLWANLTLLEQDEALLPLADGLEPGSDAYSVFINVDDPTAAGHQKELCSTPVVGKFRHAWIVVSPGTVIDSFEETIVPKVVQAARHMVRGAIPPVTQLTPKTNPSTDQARKPQGKHGKTAGDRRRRRTRRLSGPMPLSADGSVLLSFSLLNADPADWVFDWDFALVEEQVLAPLVQAISPMAELAVESQVLYYARSQVRPTWSPQHQAYLLPHSSLPFFVNSHDWHLDTSVASAGRSKLLHFAVYVPAADECPLHFQLPNGQLSPTDGFTVPSWGGVVVWNPPQCSRNVSAPIGPQRIPPSDLRRLLAIQIGQLRTLFGLPAAPKQSAEVQTLSPGPKGFTGWEVAALLRRRSVEDTREALSTLRSLSTLVTALPNMVVHDSIADQMMRALAASSEAQTAILAGSYEAAASAARKARAHAESAFFHPTLMSLLYFPSEHHLAIYMPLFLPVLVNVCAAVFLETLRWGRARCRRRLSEALSRVKHKQS